MSSLVASLTITYNGRDLLDRQLKALAAQVWPLAEIIVVDNASADDTADFVAATYPQVTFIKLGANEGVGGGYAAGLEYAIGVKNYDWVWMLDQDSVPGPETLSQLIEAWTTSNCREEIGIMAPLSVDADTGTPYPIFIWRNKQVDLSLSELEAPLCFVDMVISSGSLIRGDAIKVAGLPRKELFIDFVDFEHCLRLRRHGFRIAVATKAVMAHTIGQPRFVSLFGKSRRWITHVAWRDYYKVRNRAFVVWHQVPSVEAKCFVLGKFVKQAFGTLLFDSDKLQRLKLMSKGLWDGIRGKLGRQIGPEG